MPAFRTVLVANRGEIACRIIRAVQAEGLRAIAVYTPADADAPHVMLADRAVCLADSEIGKSYLSIPAMLAAARTSGAEAVHPGYGFLSENALFAQACVDAGLIFIGPPAAAIAAMGNKSAAKHCMLAAGVPCIPGYSGPEQDLETLARQAQALGFPLMVKAAAGGGGRGMRLVREPSEFADALTSARGEAEKTFGSGELLLEKAIVSGRHVEIQILADEHGNILHLGERDCSAQRRHQKIIEEAPSPVVDVTLRERMGQAAIAAARAVNYVGAGTVEFMLDAAGGFYFLEMNTRLQVEHPVTEMVTGIDLVTAQLRIAQGRPLPWRQADIRLHGHAIEARLYAEDPARGFLPQTGIVEEFLAPIGEGLRCDAGIGSGSRVSAHYDPMLAKIIAWGEDREQARNRLIAALEKTLVLGISHNLGFLRRLLGHPVFSEGRVTTGFLATAEAAELLDPAPATEEQAMLAAAVLAREEAGERFPGWCNTRLPPAYFRLEFESPGESDIREFDLVVNRDGSLESAWGKADFRPLDSGRGEWRVHADPGVDSRQPVAFVHRDDTLWLKLGIEHYRVRDRQRQGPTPRETPGDGLIRAPMTGCLQRLLVAVGETVRRGQGLAVLEAMKMEHVLKADRDGVVAELRADPGANVDAGTLLFRLTGPSP